MMEITPPLDNAELLLCENEDITSEESALTISSARSFKEFMREKPKKVALEECEDKDESENEGCALCDAHPTPFSLIQSEAKESAQKTPRPSSEKIANTSPVKRSALSDEINPPSIQPELVQASPLLAPPPVSTSKPHIAAPQILPHIFEIATREITHVVKNEMQETTLTLDGPLFANTPLAGIKMTVREYSTAPLSYNIHFVCVPEALNYLQPHLKTLASIFQSKRSSYSIHSIEADLGDGIPSPIDRDSEGDEDHEEQHERG